VSEPAVSVRAEDHPSWDDVVRHAEHGEQIAVIAHGQHVADIVPSGELDRLHETIDVLSNPQARAALEDTEPVVFGADAIRAIVVKRAAREAR